MPSRARIRAAVALLIAVPLALVSCAEERDPINRVQPNGLTKSMFDGEWYYQRTVVETPAADGFTFVGMSDFAGMSKVTFDIQENLLLARRSIELIKGSDLADIEGEDYEGEVIAAFKIQSQFDVVNAYNPTTGEKLNIVEENSHDRPWYEREYIRVDWSENLVHNYNLDFETQSVESIPYYVQAFDEATGDRNPDAPLIEEDGSYFDVTNKLFAKAGTTEIEGYGEIPMCWLFGHEFEECGAGEYTIRHSFLKLDPNRQYEPMPYKGKATEVFGYFTSDRTVYDAKEGIRQQNKERYLNRYNIWKRWRDDDGKLIAPKDREIRPIVYHVNREFPDDLRAISMKVGDQWNSAFVDVVKALGHEPGDNRVFIMCPNNPIESGDPAECGEPGSSPRIGDIRYSFMAYVPRYMTYGLLGLGPSNNDPETGETISGAAYVYHHNNTAAFDTLEMTELLNGIADPTDHIDGVDLTDWAERARGERSSAPRTYGLDDADTMIDGLANGFASQYWAGRRQAITPEDIEFQKKNGARKWIGAQLDDMHAQGLHTAERYAGKSRLANVAGTYLEELLLNDEMLWAAGHTPGLPVSNEVYQRASLANGGLIGFFDKLDKTRSLIGEARNMYTREMADDALMGLARELKDVPSDEALEIIRESIYSAVLAHEVGHALGLMHNFGGSDDAINYHDEYWQIRDDGEVAPRLIDPISQDEIDSNIYNFAYSSIMDYAGRLTTDGKGIGKYDRSAMLFGYAEKVEVFKDNVGVPHSEFRDWFDFDGDVLNIDITGPKSVHYTSFYNRMGTKLYDADNRMLVDVADLSDDFSTAEVDGQEYTRVPYIYCSHSQSDLGDHCLSRDAGADSMERMKNMLDDLDTWYIRRNFPRGVIGRDHFSYVGRYYRRTYDRLKNWNDMYALMSELLGKFFDPGSTAVFLGDVENGWGAKTWAVQNAFNRLVQTIFMPNVGTFSPPMIQPDGNTLMVYQLGDAAQLGVDQARHFSTSWGDGDRECGYMFWECLHHVGFYLDKVMAIYALSDAETNFVARATPDDIRQWAISYYTTFPDQISRINEAMMRRDFESVGPYLEDGELHFPNYAGKMDTAHAAAVDPQATFTVQLFWQVLGQARFQHTYNRDFVDESKVFVIGQWNSPVISPDRLVTYDDPVAGLRYGALRMDNGQMGAGQALLERAQKLHAASSRCDFNNSTEPGWDDCRAADPQIRLTWPGGFIDAEYYDHLELLKTMADLTPILEHGDPFNL